MAVSYTLIERTSNGHDYIECPDLLALNSELRKHGLRIEVQFLDDRLLKK